MQNKELWPVFTLLTHLLSEIRKMGSNEPDLKALGGLSNIITKLMFQQTTGKRDSKLRVL